MIINLRENCIGTPCTYFQQIWPGEDPGLARLTLVLHHCFQVGQLQGVSSQVHEWLKATRCRYLQPLVRLGHLYTTSSWKHQVPIRSLKLKKTLVSCLSEWIDVLIPNKVNEMKYPIIHNAFVVVREH